MTRLIALLFCLLLAACAPAQPAANQPPPPPPFPTMTPGRLVRGLLPPLDAPTDAPSRLANPATAVALANQPTPTPDYAACPPPASPQWPPLLPPTGPAIINAIAQFLSDGGAFAALETGLREEWGLLGATGFARADADFIGAGAPQIVLAYTAPDDGPSLLILGCAGGRYAPLYQAVTSSPAQILQLADLTYDNRAELLFSSRQCSPENVEDCAYNTQLIGWSAEAGRFVSLLNRAIASSEPPTASDIDSDAVLEIVVRLTDAGDRDSGPLRTGVNIYDWNGAYYALSIVQLDPPRYLVQVIHEADRAFERSDIQAAISLFELALNDSTLRAWFDDDPPLLRSYAQYRLLLLYAYTEQEQRALDIFDQSLAAFPTTDAPVYTSLMDVFWFGFQQTNNLRAGCDQVRGIIETRLEAVGFLNRYGSRSPVYTTADLCPF